MKSWRQTFDIIGAWLAKLIGFEESRGWPFYFAKHTSAFIQTAMTAVAVMIPTLTLHLFYYMGIVVRPPTFSEMAISVVGSSISFIAIYFKLGVNRRIFGEYSLATLINMAALILAIGFHIRYAQDGDIAGPINRACFAILCIWTLYTMFDARRLQYSEKSDLVDTRNGEIDILSRRVFGGNQP